MTYIKTELLSLFVTKIATLLYNAVAQRGAVSVLLMNCYPLSMGCKVQEMNYSISLAFSIDQSDSEHLNDFDVANKLITELSQSFGEPYMKFYEKQATLTLYEYHWSNHCD